MSKVNKNTTITLAIVERLKSIDISQWEKPWIGSIALQINSRGDNYRGVNAFNLGLAASFKGYSSNQWFTFNKARELGAKVRKGERAEYVLHVSQVLKKTGEEKLKRGEEITPDDKRPLFRYHAVFNADQIDDLKEYSIPSPISTTDTRPIQELHHLASKVIDNMAINYEETEKPRAFYSEHEDKVHMPVIGLFKTQIGFYDTFFHEIAHATKHKKRLDRNFEKSTGFGSEGYAREELVAELTSAFVANSLGYAHGQIENHAQYLKSWIAVLENDHNAIFLHAAQAQKATDYILQMAGVLSETSDEKLEEVA